MVQKAINAAEALYSIAIGTVKISTCLLFLRLIPRRGFQLFLISLATFIGLYCFITIMITVFQCRPVAGAWDPTVISTCINISLAWEIMGAFNVLTDVALLLAPLPHLWGLHVPLRQKVQVIGIFCIGGL